MQKSTPSDAISFPDAVRKIASLLGCANADAWRGHRAGTLLCVGVALNESEGFTVTLSGSSFPWMNCHRVEFGSLPFAEPDVIFRIRTAADATAPSDSEGGEE